MGKIVTCIAVAGLIFASNSAMVSATPRKVTLKPTMLYANTDKISCRQVSANGKVYADSKRSVSWVLEYRDTNGQWQYQVPYTKWKRIPANTIAPTITGKIYNKCDQRLQLNPYGEGAKGKGGHAYGKLMVVTP